jgi:hypothetical protein
MGQNYLIMKTHLKKDFHIYNDVIFSVEIILSIIFLSLNYLPTMCDMTA